MFRSLLRLYGILLLFGGQISIFCTIVQHSTVPMTNEASFAIVIMSHLYRKGKMICKRKKKLLCFIKIYTDSVDCTHRYYTGFDISCLDRLGRYHPLYIMPSSHAADSTKDCVFFSCAVEIFYLAEVSTGMTMYRESGNRKGFILLKAVANIQKAGIKTLPCKCIMKKIILLLLQ